MLVIVSYYLCQIRSPKILHTQSSVVHCVLENGLLVFDLTTVRRYPFTVPTYNFQTTLLLPCPPRGIVCLLLFVQRG
jgi:ubiquitin-protein ligase